MRLENPASNLAHVSTFIKLGLTKAAVIQVIEESKNFIEWTAIDHDVSTRIELADLERQLARWQNEIDDILADDAKRLDVVSQAREMSDGLIAKSGLLNQ